MNFFLDLQNSESKLPSAKKLQTQQATFLNVLRNGPSVSSEGVFAEPGLLFIYLDVQHQSFLVPGCDVSRG